MKVAGEKRRPGQSFTEVEHLAGFPDCALGAAGEDARRTAAWTAALLSLEKREKWRTPSYFGQRYKGKPA